MGKAVAAAELHGVQQNGLSGGVVTRSREYVGVSDALDDLPLGCGRGAAHRVKGQAEGPGVVSGVEQSAQLDLPPDEGIEQRAAGPMDIGQPLVGGADLSEKGTVSRLADRPRQQRESGTAIRIAHRGINGLLEHRDSTGGLPGLAQLIAVHLQRVRREGRPGVEMACGGEALGCPSGGHPQTLIWQHSTQAHPEADPCLPEHREGGLFEMAFCGPGLQSRD